MSRTLGGAALALLMALLVGCGTAAPNAQGSASSSKAQTAAASATVMVAPVKTASVTVGGKSHTVLTNANGYTLYYFTKDTATTSACTGSCASLWPALTTTAHKLKSPSGLGSFSVVSDSHGSQVAYNGHLLYTYTGDSAPGQANGQGLHLDGGIWWVATPSLTAGSASASSSSSGGGW